MQKRQKLKSKFEKNVFSKFRVALDYLKRSRICKAVKKRYNKRVRQEAKSDIEEYERDI